MALYLKFLIPIASVFGLSLVSGVGIYIYQLKSEISFLNNKVKTAEYDLLKVKSDLLLQNQKLIEESNRVAKYNNMVSIYKNAIDNKYSNDKITDKCEDNISIINGIFKKQGSFYGK